MIFSQHHSSAASANSKTIVFLDSNVQNYQGLVAGVVPGAAIVVLNAEQDGIEQITTALSQHEDIGSIHVVSHGSPGSLQLGNSWLNHGNLEQYAESLKLWGRSLTAKANLFLYGCNVAADAAGVAFIQQIAQLTQTVVAASHNLTGHPTLGGDWELEITTGKISTCPIFQKSVLESYAHVLTNVQINDVIVEEGDSGTQIVTFTVSLDAAAATALNVDYEVAGNTATKEDNDYSSANPTGKGTLNFAAGTTTQTITVQVNGDTKFEADETFTVLLSNNPPIGQSYTITKAKGIGVIINDDAAPTFSISDATVIEGNNSAITPVTFTISRSGNINQSSTISYATASDTATSSADFISTSGTLNFASGEASKTITVDVQGDDLFEVDESFFVNLFDPNNATIADAQGTGTITNDDLAPAIAALSIDNPTVTEGDSGTTNLTFTVTRSGDTSQISTVNYATANGTATEPGDYVAANGILTFAAGDVTKTVTIAVKGDSIVEGDETVLVNLINSLGATITTAQGTGTITNDDVIAGAIPTISINDISISEGNAPISTANFIVTLSAPSLKPITVAYATADGTAAIADQDYNSTSGIVTFAPGIITQTISVPIRGNLNTEPDENFVINLSNPINATIADAQGNGVIVNDDLPPILSVNDVTITEGDNGTVNAMFTVSLNLISTQAISVQYQTVDGTATATDGDYTAASPTSITFNPGESSKTVNVAVKGDTKVEPNETFSINLTQSLNAVISKATGTATIINNDKQTIPPKVITPPKVVPSGEILPGGTTPGNTKPISNQVSGTSGNDNLSGTSRPDVLIGNDGNDIIRGLDGDDLIFGSNGNDQLFGGGGNDVIYGRDGKDKLFGDAGDDILIGGFRNDVITGGTGKDRFEFRGLQQGIDRITDFSVVDDTFALLKQNFKGGLKVGILTNDQFRLGAKALDKGDRFIYNAQTGGLFFDIDGSGGSKQVQLAHLAKGLALTRQDCVVI